MRLQDRRITSALWHDPKLLRLPRDARVLFHGLLHLADDSGHVDYDLAAIQSRLFGSPLDSDMTVERLKDMLQHLAAGGLLVVPDDKGARGLLISGFQQFCILNPVAE